MNVSFLCHLSCHCALRQRRVRTSDRPQTVKMGEGNQAACRKKWGNVFLEGGGHITFQKGVVMQS